MGKPLYTPAQISRAVEMVRSGKSRPTSAKATGMSLEAVRNHALNAGVVAAQSFRGHRTSFRPGARPFTPDEDTQIAALRELGLGYMKIGTALGRNHTSIRSRILTLQQIALRNAPVLERKDVVAVIVALRRGETIDAVAARYKGATVQDVIKLLHLNGFGWRGGQVVHNFMSGECGSLNDAISRVEDVERQCDRAMGYRYPSPGTVKP